MVVFKFLSAFLGYSDKLKFDLNVIGRLHAIIVLLN